MSTKELLAQFHEIATNPAKVKADYLAKGRKIVLTTYYTPEELDSFYGHCSNGSLWCRHPVK